MPVDLLAHIFHDRLPLARPAEALADIVEGYHHITWNGREENVWVSLDGAPVLIFILGGSQELVFRGGRNRVFEGAFFCSFGLQETYIASLPKGLRLLIVRFTSVGLYHLLRQPLETGMPEALCSIKDVWGDEGDGLTKSVGDEAHAPEMQIALIEAFLLKKAPAFADRNYKLSAAEKLILDSRGLLSVAALCDTLHVNYKWLERNFRRYLGITPKAYLGNIRFLHAYFSLMKGNIELIDVALENGYYDQNHFIRDCRKYTGQVPSGITSLYLQEQPVL